MSKMLLDYGRIRSCQNPGGTEKRVRVYHDKSGFIGTVAKQPDSSWQADHLLSKSLGDKTMYIRAASLKNCIRACERQFQRNNWNIDKEAHHAS